MKPSYDLIVTIVNMGSSEKIIKASKEAGAEGGTIILGRGTGIHEKKTLLGIPIEPEKEIVLTAVPRSRTERVLAAIVKGGELDKPGTGIAFVLELKEIEGICHLLMKE
ncbi:MAG: P-II family nitrogen regulator [Candidatus Aminicenantes bacterium]|nr:P-II family nitrogen regulator [Candidatus Aminicenantes bacterium]